MEREDRGSSNTNWLRRLLNRARNGLKERKRNRQLKQLKKEFRQLLKEGKKVQEKQMELAKKSHYMACRMEMITAMTRELL